MKGGGRIVLFLIIVVAVVAIFLFLRRGATGPLFGPRQQTPVIPLDLQALVPSSWNVQPQPQLTCDFDGDGTNERLLIYRYNGTSLPQPLAAKAGTLAGYAPFGGVIYDTQAGTLEAAPQSPGPYRTSNLVPYKLLPDYYPGKGQGYLGETAVDVRLFSDTAAKNGCAATEINIYGYSGGQLPTRLSIFRWAGVDAGYQVTHFAGDARVDATLTAGGQVQSAVTYNRLLNHRSILCDVAGYTRPDLKILTFIPNAAVQTVDFCFGPPGEPVYPEGVVVAFLRGSTPSTTEAPRFLLDNAVLDPGLQVLKDAGRKPINIVTVGNPSSVAPMPESGGSCSTDQIKTADKDALWCGRERVQIKTRVVLEGQQRDLLWTLISVIPNRINSDLYWRISQVDLLPQG